MSSVSATATSQLSAGQLDSVRRSNTIPVPLQSVTEVSLQGEQGAHDYSVATTPRLDVADLPTAPCGADVLPYIGSAPEVERA